MWRSRGGRGRAAEGKMARTALGGGEPCQPRRHLRPQPGVADRRRQTVGAQPPRLGDAGAGICPLRRVKCIPSEWTEQETEYFRLLRVSSLLDQRALSSLNSSGEIETGASKLRVERRALTESTSPPDRKVGAAAYVQFVPTGVAKGRRGSFHAACKHLGQLGKLGGGFFIVRKSSA
jgi:hypothetical protein